MKNFFNTFLLKLKSFDIETLKSLFILVISKEFILI